METPKALGGGNVQALSVDGPGLGQPQRPQQRPRELDHSIAQEKGGKGPILGVGRRLLEKGF